MSTGCKDIILPRRAKLWYPGKDIWVRKRGFSTQLLIPGCGCCGDTHATVWFIDSNYDILQTFDTGTTARDAVRDAAGNVYVVGNRDITNERSVWKFNSVGRLLWSYDTSSATFGIVIDDVGGDRFIWVVGTRDASNSISVWKLEPTDTDTPLKWGYDTGDNTYNIETTQAGDGIVYVVGERSSNKSVWSLNNAGSLSWSFDSEHVAQGVGFVSGVAGGIYVSGETGLDGNNMWKLNSSGVEQWGKIPGYGLRLQPVNSSILHLCGGINAQPKDRIGQFNGSGVLARTFIDTGNIINDMFVRSTFVTDHVTGEGKIKRVTAWGSTPFISQTSAVFSSNLIATKITSLGNSLICGARAAL